MISPASMTGAALGAVDAATLARAARRTPEPVLRASVAGPMRRVVVRQIFRRMPAQMKRSNPQAEAVVRWDVADEGRPTETWFLSFADGRARTGREPPAEQPRVTLTLGALELVRLASGSENPMQMFQSGRIKISGDLFFAAQLQSLFTIPS